MQETNVYNFRCNASLDILFSGMLLSVSSMMKFRKEHIADALILSGLVVNILIIIVVVIYYFTK